MEETRVRRSRWTGKTKAEIRAETEEARQAARFAAARDRITKIANTAPALSREQIEQLRALLPVPTEGGGGLDDAA